jgi:hypothetical protein
MKFKMLLILFVVHGIICSQTFIREYNYNASEKDSKISARESALEQVKKSLMEELGVYINSNISRTIIEDNQKLEDITEVKTQIISECITKTRILNENWDGNTYHVKAEISIDKDDMMNRLDKLSQASDHSTSPIIEQFSNGQIDWENKIVTVEGFGMANTNFPEEVWKKSAEEAATVDAQAKLLELINGFDLESKVFIKNYQLNKDEKIKQIRGKLKYVEKFGPTEYPDEKTAKVWLRLDLEEVL